MQHDQKTLSASSGDRLEWSRPRIYTEGPREFLDAPGLVCYQRQPGPDPSEDIGGSDDGCLATKVWVWEGWWEKHG